MATTVCEQNKEDSTNHLGAIHPTSRGLIACERSVSWICRAEVRPRPETDKSRNVRCCLELDRLCLHAARQDRRLAWGVNVGRANSVGSDFSMVCPYATVPGHVFPSCNVGPEPVRASCNAPPWRSERGTSPRKATLARAAMQWNVLLWASWSKGQID